MAVDGRQMQELRTWKAMVHTYDVLVVWFYHLEADLLIHHTI